MVPWRSFHTVGEGPMLHQRWRVIKLLDSSKETVMVCIVDTLISSPRTRACEHVQGGQQCWWKQPCSSSALIKSHWQTNGGNGGSRTLLMIIYSENRQWCGQSKLSRNGECREWAANYGTRTTCTCSPLADDARQCHLGILAILDKDKDGRREE